MKRVDEKNGNKNGRIDFAEFLPWYTKIAEKHYNFVNAEPEVCKSEEIGRETLLPYLEVSPELFPPVCNRHLLVHITSS